MVQAPVHAETSQRYCVFARSTPAGTVKLDDAKAKLSERTTSVAPYGYFNILTNQEAAPAPPLHANVGVKLEMAPLGAMARGAVSPVRLYVTEKFALLVAPAVFLTVTVHAVAPLGSALAMTVGAINMAVVEMLLTFAFQLVSFRFQMAEPEVAPVQLNAIRSTFVKSLPDSVSAGEYGAVELETDAGEMLFSWSGLAGAVT